MAKRGMPPPWRGSAWPCERNGRTVHLKLDRDAPFRRTKARETGGVRVFRTHDTGTLTSSEHRQEIRSPPWARPGSAACSLVVVFASLFGCLG